MTGTQRILMRRRASLWILAALLFLGGAIGVAFLQISHESDRADQLADEADLRGTAVSTLAGDVRALRSQVQAAGKTPVAPDPTAAVPGLPDRTAVPVPIPGPPGLKGDKGDPGVAASPVPGPSGSPGTPGAQGAPGADSTVPGPQGEQGVPGVAGQPGKDGVNGTNGRDGADGQPPAGWSWTWTDQLGTVHTYSCVPVDGFDPATPRYTCPEATTAPASPASPASKRSGLLGVGMMALSASYRRL